MRYPALLEPNADARGCEYACFGSRPWQALKNLGRIYRVNEAILPRKLWYADVREHICVDQSFLQADQRSLVVLGEAGMGKSTLLAQLADVEGYAFCTARKLINSPHPANILGDAQTLVIDALDEVSAQRDRDAVDLVMWRLGVLSNPRFILSCRVADWRSATGLQGIADLYDRAPLELHLVPLDRADALAFLAETLGDARAEAAINHLEARGLSGLWANPQTLKLVGKVASQDRLPSSKGNLFTEATKLLRAEHREEKAATTLAGMGEAEVLDAAGAAFATLILTGKDALSRRVNDNGHDLPIREISSLPGASNVEDILDSRLFVARGSERFAYAHRAIGEFLGARWLARNADTPRKQHRLLSLFSNHAVVPASLRGIHSWLAWHSSELAAPVIAADPMGVVEYGDADRLTPEQGRALFRALQSVSRDNPRFRDWSEYRVGGLIQPALLPEIREILTDPEVEFGLRLLVLQALKGSPLVQDLADTLLALLLNPMAIFANRREAGNRLADLEASVDWPDIVAQLRAQDDEDGVRLASELMDEIGYDRFGDELVLDVVLAQLRRTERTVGVYRAVERNFPVERLEPLLDGIAAEAQRLGNHHERWRNNAITDLAYGLLARRLQRGDVAAEQLWRWLQPFDSQVGLHRETRKVVAQILGGDESLRRAVQRHVLFEQPGDKTVWQRSWRLAKRSSGLAPNEDDVIALLDQLPSDDARWRDLVQLVPNGSDQGAAVRAAATRFTASSEEDAAWLAGLATPRMSEWQLEQEERQRQQRDERDREWERHRAEFTERIKDMWAGEYSAVINPAKAYLKLFYDMGEEASDGPSRLEEWLGAELKRACLAGFERFLTATPFRPTATDIAESYAEGSRWDAGYIIVAALAERQRTGRGFDDLPEERLMAGLFEVRHTRIDDHAGIADLDGTLAEALRARGAWEKTQRLYFEPQLAAQRAHVDGLYALMREDRDAELATSFAHDWLERFPEMVGEAEVELVDHLLATPQGRTGLRSLLPQRRSAAMSDERRRIWDAVGLVVDFEQTRAALEGAGPIEPELFWHVRSRLGDRRSGARTLLDGTQLAWMIAAFRPLFPSVRRPNGVTTGDTNPWDASDFMGALIKRLGDEVSDSAIAVLTALRDAGADGYTDLLRVAAAEQKRKRVEADWTAPDFTTVASTVADNAPTTPAQLQAVLLEELRVVQAKLRGSDVDWYRDFSKDGVPRVEDECRDTILKMLRPLPFGIAATPEGHLADDKRCDIICTLGDTMVPVEIKGQWHPQLWTAADRQLDHLYVNDWRAERGIYLVLWFGRDVSKTPVKPAQGAAAPQTAEALQAALEARSATTREGRTEVVVLDLTRPG